VRRVLPTAVLFGIAFALVASGLSVTTVRANPGVERNYTLFGDLVQGWGFTDTTITEPGPDLTVSVGDDVTLTLNSADGEPHNWFIDYDNDNVVDSGEPSSADFETSTITYTFTPDRAGTFTYRCRFHPTTMTGTIIVQPAAVFVLYGSAEPGANGWGLTSTTIDQPGPTLTVDLGDTVTIDLVAADDEPHTFVVDYDNDGVADAGEPTSAVFSGTDVLRYPFTADRAGTFQYFCSVHGAATMNGTFVVNAPAPGPSGDNTLLIIGGVIIAVVVAVVAAAMLMRKKKA
jgi:plastocyanin